MPNSTIHLGEAQHKLAVLSRRVAADGVVVLDLGHEDGAPLPEWQAGAHIDLELANGLTRQYSLCGVPGDRTRWTIGVLREQQSRGGSTFVHDVLHPGVRVSVVGPRNHFALQPSRNYVFIAGGIGITPILPMIKAAQNAGANWTLTYGGRTRSSMGFLNDLAPYGTKVSLQAFDEVGHIDLASLLDIPRPETLVYACGPEPLLAAIEAKCAVWGHGVLHVERFTAKPLDAPVCSGPFEIECARDGRVLTVPPGRSIMEVLEMAGYQVLCSCREGVCGSCETKLVSGLADHRDSVLSDDEKLRNDRMMVCVSRSRDGGRLVLDF